MALNDPKWWNDDTTSGWDRVKEALKRDWEQTKADFSKTRGQELGQGADDTVKQAIGKQPIPPQGVANAPEWDHVEPGVRYGWGAARQYKDHADWGSAEGKLKEEWNDLKSGRTWEETKDFARRGWDSARRKAS
jgi:hypothetical protein